jgi:hypothetical protein
VYPTVASLQLTFPDHTRVVDHAHVGGDAKAHNSHIHHDETERSTKPKGSVVQQRVPETLREGV